MEINFPGALQKMDTKKWCITISNKGTHEHVWENRHSLKGREER